MTLGRTIAAATHYFKMGNDTDQPQSAHLNQGIKQNSSKEERESHFHDAILRMLKKNLYY